MSQEVAVATTVILVQGISNHDELVEMEIPIQHQLGVHRGLIIAEAIKVVRANGGLLVDGADEDLNFYPLLSLKGRINFKEKRVVLSSGPSSSPRVHLV